MTARLGGAAWAIGVAQFFAAHAVVEAAWTPPYSWSAHNISDLGNVRCAVQGDADPRYVCSPQHALMNGSFVALGALFLAGALLTRPWWGSGPAAAASRSLLAAAAAGFALVGLAPADSAESLHVLGALLAMGAGNAGLVLAAAGLADRVSRPWRRAAAVLGLTAFAACGLLLVRQYLGLGMGGMERVAAFPLLLWTFALGLAGLLGRVGREPPAPRSARPAPLPGGSGRRT